jgi:hypothetical protein
MILSSFERKDSPFIYIQFGESYSDRRYFRTRIRKNDPERRRKVARELERIELQIAPGPQRAATGSRDGDGWRWVKPFIETRYAGRARTRQVYLAQWRSVRIFLVENEVASPFALSREVVFEYPTWRCEQVKEKSKRSPRLNTAIGELKLLALVLDEAKRRGLAAENVARGLEIGREESEPRPEITDEMFAVIWRELKRQPEWMRKSFWIALNTGLRFATTKLHRSQIRPASDDILIERPKGGRKREFAIPIYPSIRAEIEKFLGGRSAYIWEAPSGTLTGLAWTKFLKSSAAYVPGLCFHSTRVTFITRGMRAGIPEPVMMKMCNHARTEISRIYQRWTSDDVRRYVDRLPALHGDGAPR